MSRNEEPPLVWIGTPQKGKSQEDVLDPYASKIGGQAVYFRVGSDAQERQDAGALSKYLQCPQCKSAAQVSLLSQLYAPLEVYDRVLYILTCAACARRPGGSSSSSGAVAPVAAPPPGVTKKSSLAAAAAAKSLTSFCFAVRSQNFSQEYFSEMQQQARAAAQQAASAEKAREEKETPLFDEGDDDWGEGADDWGDADCETSEPVASASAPESSPPEPSSSEAQICSSTVQQQTAYPLAKRGMAAPLKGPVYTSGLALDLYVEPVKAKAKELSIEGQLAVAETMYGENGAVDTSGFEEDDETPAEACVREYMEAMEANPSQCVRWCPGGTPLRTTLTAVGVNGATVPPPCPACGAPRQFEVQLTAPAVYFLTKEMGEAKNATLHFSNVLVYTCSKHCYASDKSAPYLPEYVVVEDEL